MHAEGLSWSTLAWCFRSPVRHLVESRVHLIHQVHVKPAEKSPVLLRVSEHLSPLHLVAHDPHNSVLQKTPKTLNNTVCRQTDKHKQILLVIRHRTLFVLTLIWSLKAKCLPEETSASISWILIWSRLKFSFLPSSSIPNSSLYWSEIWSTTLPTCLRKSSTACRRETHTP